MSWYSERCAQKAIDADPQDVNGMNLKKILENVISTGVLTCTMTERKLLIENGYIKDAANPEGPATRYTLTEDGWKILKWASKKRKK